MGPAGSSSRGDVPLGDARPHLRSVPRVHSAPLKTRVEHCPLPTPTVTAQEEAGEGTGLKVTELDRVLLHILPVTGMLRPFRCLLFPSASPLPRCHSGVDVGRRNTEQSGNDREQAISPLLSPVSSHPCVTSRSPPAAAVSDPTSHGASRPIWPPLPHPPGKQLNWIFFPVLNPPTISPASFLRNGRDKKTAESVLTSTAAQHPAGPLCPALGLVSSVSPTKAPPQICSLTQEQP